MFSKGKIHAHILLIVIIVMLLFAIGASYQTITKDQNILNTVDVEHGQRETELLNQFVSPSFRKPPSLKNFWRWSETWFIAFIMICYQTFTKVLR